MMYLTDEPTIAKNLIGSVLGAKSFHVTISQKHVRVTSDKFWFDLTKDEDCITVVSLHTQPIVVKSFISMQRLKHFIETELNLYLKRYYSIIAKEEDGITTITAMKRATYE